MVSIVDHPGMDASYIDSAVGISDLFPLLAPVIREVQTSGAKVPETETAAGLGWAFSINLPSTLPAEDTMSVWGLPNVLRILDDIDKGKLQRYTFIECHACFEGCVSGALTVENPYVARARALRLQQSLPKRDPVDPADMRARHERGEFRTTVPFAVRPPRPLGRDIVTAITRMQERDRVAARLPGIDCGACGSPTCATFAEDVVMGEAGEAQCVVLRQGQLEEQLARLAAQGAAATREYDAAGRSSDDRH
jgi:ferredoxin